MENKAFGVAVYGVAALAIASLLYLDNVSTIWQARALMPSGKLVGQTKAAMLSDAVRSCISSQSRNPVNLKAAGSVARIAVYCWCVATKEYDAVTIDQANFILKNGKIPTEFQAAVNGFSRECITQ